MSSFAYLFHPSTNIHSYYTPIFTLVTILISEHIYVVLRLGIRQAIHLLYPNASEYLVKKEEYKLKKVWLERMIGNHEAFISATEQHDNSDLSQGLSAKIWRNHLNQPKIEVDTAVQIVQNAFKTE